MADSVPDAAAVEAAAAPAGAETAPAADGAALARPSAAAAAAAVNAEFRCAMLYISLIFFISSIPIQSQN